MKTVHDHSYFGVPFSLFRDRLCDQIAVQSRRIAAFGVCEACPGHQMIVVGLPTLREAEAAMREHVLAEHT